MTKPKTDLDYLHKQKDKAEQKLRYYQHQEKMLEHRIPELTRKARTHRLCTRGGMLESFLICPGELTDDLSFCSSRPGPKHTPLSPKAESTTEYDSRPFIKRTVCLFGR